MGDHLPGDIHLSVRHPGHGGDFLLERGADLIEDPVGREAEDHLDLDLAARDLDALDAGGPDKVTPQTGLDIGLEGGFDGFFGDV